VVKRASTPAKTGGKTDLVPIRPIAGALVKDGKAFVATERAVGAVEAAAAAGVSTAGIAALLGCSREALRQMRERQPELDAALSRGLASFEAELVGHLVAAMRKGAFVPAIFLLKARFGYREGDAPESKPNIIINLPDAMAPAAYLDMLAKRQRAVIEGEQRDPAALQVTR
jgi:hypothetical protein